MRYQFTFVLLLLNLLVFGFIALKFVRPSGTELDVNSLQRKIQSVLADPTRIELISAGLTKSIQLERSECNGNLRRQKNGPQITLPSTI